MLMRKKIRAILKNGDYLEGPLTNGVYTPTSKPEVINIIYDDFLNVEFEHELGIYKHHHRINGLNGTDILTLGYSDDFKSKLIDLFIFKISYLIFKFLSISSKFIFFFPFTE